MLGSVVVEVRWFPTGRVESYAGKTHFLGCQSTPAPTNVQIRSAFAPSTHCKPGYHLYWKAGVVNSAQSPLQKGPQTELMAGAAELVPLPLSITNMRLMSGGPVVAS